MTLNGLLKEIGTECAFGDVTVTAVTDCVEDVIPGCVFVAVAGNRTDGNRFAGRALSMGAAAVVTARGTGSAREIVVRDPRHAYSALCAAGYASGDYDYTVSRDGVEVSVDGTSYTLSEGGELIEARF